MRVKSRNNKYNINTVRLREKEKNQPNKTNRKSWKKMTLFLIKQTVINLISFDSQRAKVFCVQGHF